MANKRSPEMIKQRKLLRKSTLIIFLGVFIASALTVLVVKQSPSIKDRYQAVQSTSDNLLQDLVAFKKNESREYIPLVGFPEAGEQLSFGVSVLRPTFVGLLVSINQQKPTLEFYTRLPPGEARKLERQGVRYLFAVTGAMKSLKFCVIYAEEKKSLRKLNAQIDLIWPRLSSSSCLTLK